MQLGRLAIALALASPYLAATGHTAPGGGKELRGWSDSPVRYLLTDDERAAWKALSDDDQRRAFVTAFWARRDPTPGTEANEALDEYERRVADADRLYAAEGGRGAFTDRGRIHILWGPPDEVAEDAAGSIREGRTTFAGSGMGSGGLSTERSVTRGVIAWTYRRPPDPDLPPNAKLVFEADPRGRYHLVSQVDAVWTQYATLPPVGQTFATGDTAPEPTPAPAVTAADLNPEQVAAALLAQALAADPTVASPLAAAALVFPTGKPEALVAVPFTLSGPDNEATPLELLAGVFPVGEDRVVHAWQMPFEIAPGSGSTPRPFGLLLDPGDWRLAVAVRRPEASQAIATGSLTVDVPDPRDGQLRPSSIVLTRGLEVLASGDLQLHKVLDRIPVGNIVLDALPGNRLAVGARPEVFFFLTGAAPGKTPGTLDVVAEYRVLAGDEVRLRFPAQPVQSSPYAQPLPLGRLAEGDYRLQIELEDRASGKRTVTTVPFAIGAGAS